MSEKMDWPTSMFETEISLDGERGNVFVALGTARRLLRQLGRQEDADQLTEQVMGANSYPDALRHIAKWFPLTCDSQRVVLAESAP